MRCTAAIDSQVCGSSDRGYEFSAKASIAAENSYKNSALTKREDGCGGGQTMGGALLPGVQLDA